MSRARNRSLPLTWTLSPAPPLRPTIPEQRPLTTGANALNPTTSSPAGTGFPGPRESVAAVVLQVSSHVPDSPSVVHQITPARPPRKSITNSAKKNQIMCVSPLPGVTPVFRQHSRRRSRRLRESFGARRRGRSAAPREIMDRPAAEFRGRVGKTLDELCAASQILPRRARSSVLPAAARGQHVQRSDVTIEFLRRPFGDTSEKQR